MPSILSLISVSDQKRKATDVFLQLHRHRIMLAKLLYAFVLFVAAQSMCSATFHRRRQHIGNKKRLQRVITCMQILYQFHSLRADIGKYNASYYDPESGVGLKAELEDSGRDPLTVKVGFRGLPCHCENLTCSCCAGVNLTAINFDRRACTKFTYEPSEFAINMALTMNEKEIYTNSLSGKGPFIFVNK